MTTTKTAPWITVIEEDLDKADAALLGLLFLVSRKQFITEDALAEPKMAKLIYLLDDHCFRHDGFTLTGLDYLYGDAGPNAAGDEIVRKLDALTESGLIHSREIALTSGERTCSYWIGERFDPDRVPLCDHDWSSLHSVLHEHGHRNCEGIARAAMQTLPVKNAERHDLIVFQPDPGIEEMKGGNRQDTDYVAAMMMADMKNGDLSAMSAHRVTARASCPIA